MIIVRGKITVVAACVTQVVVKNSVLFTQYIPEVDRTKIDDAEDLDLVVIMYNLLEYSSSYSDKTGSLWFHSKDEATNFNADIANTDAC